MEKMLKGVQRTQKTEPPRLASTTAASGAPVGQARHPASGQQQRHCGCRPAAAQSGACEAPQPAAPAPHGTHLARSWIDGRRGSRRPAQGEREARCQTRCRGGAGEDRPVSNPVPDEAEGIEAEAGSSCASPFDQDASAQLASVWT
jgi:hypothetical protein